jgi:hypothetical protein
MEEKKIGNKTYLESEEIQKFANEVIKKDSIKLYANFNELNVVYMLVYPNISPTLAGRCIRTSNLVKLFSNADIIIQMSGELWDNIPDNVKYILTLHEMKHAGIIYTKTGEKKIKIVDHNVKDFYDIIKEYGIDWIETLKTISANVNEFEKGEEEKIKI